MVTLFTPQNSALLLIDHQVGTMQLIRNIAVDRAKQMLLGSPRPPTSWAFRRC